MEVVVKKHAANKNNHFGTPKNILQTKIEHDISNAHVEKYTNGSFKSVIY